jgi:hypothetical protein
VGGAVGPQADVGAGRMIFPQIGIQLPKKLKGYVLEARNPLFLL